MKKLSAMIRPNKLYPLLENIVTKSKIYGLSISESKGFESPLFF